MPIEPSKIILELLPKARLYVTNVSDRITEEYGSLLRNYHRLLLCSLHTTAGYLEEDLSAKLGHNERRLRQFIRSFQKIFPQNAGYSHDRLELRAELAECEKEKEPLNADSHLTFIGAGLENCVEHVNETDSPVYFVDLDGVYKKHHRRRSTVILAYNKRKLVYHGEFRIPVPEGRSINSFAPITRHSCAADRDQDFFKEEHRRHNRWTVHYFYPDGHVVNFKDGLVVGKK